MSPISQFAAVTTITLAILGFQTIAFVGLGLTLALLLLGYAGGITIGAPPPVAPQDRSPVADPTPNERADRDD